MRDSAIRVELGIPLTVAAKLARVSRPTLRLYELDPQSIRSAEKRAECAKLYDLLRGLLAAAGRD